VSCGDNGKRVEHSRHMVLHRTHVGFSVQTWDPRRGGLLLNSV
jgi:hypothetical protein